MRVGWTLTRCFLIKYIELKGADSLSVAERDQLLKPYVGQCLGVAQLNELLKVIADHYIEKGLVNSRAYLCLTYAAELDMPLEGEISDDVNMRKLRGLHQCMTTQKKAFQAGFGKQFVNGLRQAHQEIPKSDIMNSLRKVGEDMQRERCE